MIRTSETLNQALPPVGALAKRGPPRSRFVDRHDRVNMAASQSDLSRAALHRQHRPIGRLILNVGKHCHVLPTHPSKH
jgi:hypothetical protein